MNTEKLFTPKEAAMMLRLKRTSDLATTARDLEAKDQRQFVWEGNERRYTLEDISFIASIKRIEFDVDYFVSKSGDVPFSKAVEGLIELYDRLTIQEQSQFLILIQNRTKLSPI